MISRAREVVLRLLASIVVLGLANQAAAQEVATLVIQDISCEGNFSTSCDFIRRQVDIRPGMAVDESRIQDARLRLGLLPNFTSVDIRLEKGSRRGLAILVIQVTEPASLNKGFALGSAWRFGGLTETLAAR